MLYVNTSYDYSGRKRKKKKANGEVYAKYVAPAFKPLEPPKTYRRETIFDTAPSRDTSVGNASKQEPKVYSGERKLLGIAAMHKSNLVPVFDEESAKDLARMRR